jgi:AraC-like DNA-binding protein
MQRIIYWTIAILSLVIVLSSAIFLTFKYLKNKPSLRNRIRSFIRSAGGFLPLPKEEQDPTLSLTSCFPVLKKSSFEEKQRLYTLEGDENCDFLFADPGNPLYKTDLEIRNRLIRYLEETKHYLSQNIRIADVARHLMTNKTYLSHAISHTMETNFSRFVNYFRIRDAIMIFRHNPAMTPVELCRSVGFGSMSSFNESFKGCTGMTPREWCRRYGKGSNPEKPNLSGYGMDIAKA